MVIGIDASRANKAHRTGTEWYSYYLIKYFARLDRENQYILYTDKPLRTDLADLEIDIYKEDKRAKPIYDNKGYQAIKSPYDNFKAKILNWPYMFFWTQGRLSLEMLFHRPDILFVPAHALPIIHPDRSVNTVHDIGFEIDKMLYNQEILGPAGSRGKKIVNFLIRLFSLGKYGANSKDYLTWSTSFSIRHSRIVIVPSQFTKNEIANVYHADPEKIKVVYNGFNQLLYRKIDDKDAVRKRLAEKLGIKGKYLLYVGRLERKKNTHNLVAAFGIIKQKHKDFDHKLILIGDASFGYDEVMYVANEYGVENDVIMPGWLEEEDLPFIYNGASMFVFPSFYEGFGIPLLQAMACGIPIAASNAASIPEVVQDAAVLFDPFDTDMMAEAIHCLAKDEDLKHGLAQKGMERAKKFSWENCAKETLELLNSLKK